MRRKRGLLTSLPSIPEDLLYAIFRCCVDSERAEVMSTLHRRHRYATYGDTASHRDTRSAAHDIAAARHTSRRTEYPIVLTIAAVCQQWRQTALSHPMLWRYITLRCGRRSTYTASQHWKLCLHRSLDVPLDIVHFDICGLTCHRCTSSLPFWRTLYMQCGKLHVDLGVGMVVLHSSPLFEPLPRLTHLSITCRTSTGDDIYPQATGSRILPGAPNLKSFHIDTPAMTCRLLGFPRPPLGRGSSRSAWTPNI